MQTHTEGIPKRFAGICRDAQALGVHRNVLTGVLNGRFRGARHAGLLERYRELIASRKAAEARGLALPAGFTFRLLRRSEAEKLAAHFPDSLRLRGARLEVVKPLILSAAA